MVRQLKKERNLGDCMNKNKNDGKIYLKQLK